MLGVKVSEGDRFVSLEADESGYADRAYLIIEALNMGTIESKKFGAVLNLAELEEFRMILENVIWKLQEAKEKSARIDHPILKESDQALADLKDKLTGDSERTDYQADQDLS